MGERASARLSLWECSPGSWDTTSEELAGVSADSQLQLPDRRRSELSLIESPFFEPSHRQGEETYTVGEIWEPCASWRFRSKISVIFSHAVFR